MAKRDSSPRTAPDEDTVIHPPRSERAGMSARIWSIAHRYRDPADYGIPMLPDWTVSRPDEGAIAFATGDDDPFISAAHPVPVRR